MVKNHILKEALIGITKFLHTAEASPGQIRDDPDYSNRAITFVVPNQA